MKKLLKQLLAVTTAIMMAITLLPAMANAEATIDYTKKGLGVTILPEFTVTPFIENKTLSVINVRDSEIEMEIQLIYRNDIWLSPAAKEFISEFQI